MSADYLGASRCRQKGRGVSGPGSDTDSQNQASKQPRERKWPQAAYTKKRAGLLRKRFLETRRAGLDGQSEVRRMRHGSITNVRRIQQHTTARFPGATLSDFNLNEEQMGFVLGAGGRVAGERRVLMVKRDAASGLTAPAAALCPGAMRRVAHFKSSTSPPISSPGLAPSSSWSPGARSRPRSQCDGAPRRRHRIRG